MTTTTADTQPLPEVPTFPFSMLTRSIWARTSTASTSTSTWPNATCCSAGSLARASRPGLNLIVAHGALSHDCKLILVHGKQVELGPWWASADMSIGPSLTDATAAFTEFQQIMNARYDDLLAAGRRKITPRPASPSTSSSSTSTPTSPLPLARRRMGEVRRAYPRPGRPGPAAGVIIILATQRPSHQIIDPSMRDLFAYRWAFRCTTDASSDAVLGQGWASEGYTAADIDPLARGSAGCCRRPASPAGSRPPS